MMQLGREGNSCNFWDIWGIHIFWLVPFAVKNVAGCSLPDNNLEPGKLLIGHQHWMTNTDQHVDTDCLMKGYIQDPSKINQNQTTKGKITLNHILTKGGLRSDSVTDFGQFSKQQSV